MEITSMQLPQSSHIQRTDRELIRYMQPGMFVKSDHWGRNLGRLLETCLVW